MSDRAPPSRGPRLPGRGAPAIWLALALALLLAACGRPPELPRLGPGDVVLAFGDSLTYGTGAGPDEGYPAVLARLIGRTVVRSGVPGETSAEGRRRLPAVLEAHRPKLVVLCTGGNDFLRKAPRAETEGNLRAMLDVAREQGVAVVLVGVPAPGVFAGPPGFYEALAEEYGLPYEGRVLKQVLYDNGLKSDPIHPNALGYRRLAEALAALLREAGAVP